MKALIQRVREASVSTNGSSCARIGQGLLIFLAVGLQDGEDNATYLAKRCVNMRIFEDADGKMNLSVKDIGGEALVISQFTLYGDTRRGNRPSFTDAAPPEIAEKLYESFVHCLQAELGEGRVGTGVFRAMMDVYLVNSGPVTLMVESKGTSTSAV